MSTFSMQTHQLSLDIPPTSNPRILRLIDTSIYATNIPIKCPLIQITSPGFNYPVNLQEATPEFSLILTACSLGLQTVDCTITSNILPDGIYQIRYSVSPNDKVFVEYHHLRTTQFINKYNQMLCKLELAACEPDAEVKDQLNELRLIKSFIDAAKIKVEDCGEDAKGMELLLYAQKRLMKMDGIKC